MKEQLTALITTALQQLQQQQVLPEECSFQIRLDNTKDKTHGDLACNIAMMLAKQAKMKPRDLADKIVAALPPSPEVTKVEIAGPGFINFFLDDAAQHQIIHTIFEQGAEYGKSRVGAGKKVQVEFVSANPTGPLHVGHGRGAAYGATVANLLEATGFDVTREYYVNDAGRQMNILGASVWLRYLEKCGEAITFPSNGYKGDYVYDIAQELKESHGTDFVFPTAQVMADLPADLQVDEQGNESGDKEAHIDALIEKAQSLLGEQYGIFFDAGLNAILDDIRDDLQEFGVVFQNWFSEKSLVTTNLVDKAVEKLKQAGHLYEKNGALWFRSTDFGDDKDRVVIRENGQATYFASDIAYHMNKFERGFDQVINIWGADHHGYIARVKASLTALGLDPEKLNVLLVQFAILYRGNERVQMSTRSGSFVTLRELRDEVGNDAARFFYVTRKSEQHMDFDLDLAKSQSKDNPVYYVQYAHARVASVFRKLEEQGLSWNQQQGLAALSRLDNDYESDVSKQLSKYPEVVERAALQYEPHLVAQYLKDLASSFHTYYNAEKVLLDDAEHRNARLTLGLAVKQVIHNGLTLMGVSAPESM